MNGQNKVLLPLLALILVFSSMNLIKALNDDSVSPEETADAIIWAEENPKSLANIAGACRFGELSEQFSQITGADTSIKEGQRKNTGYNTDTLAKMYVTESDGFEYKASDLKTPNGKKCLTTSILSRIGR